MKVEKRTRKRMPLYQVQVMGSCDCSKNPENIIKRKYPCSFNQIKKHTKKTTIFETRNVNNTDQIMTPVLNLDQTKRLKKKKVPERQNEKRARSQNMKNGFLGF